MHFIEMNTVLHTLQCCTIQIIAYKEVLHSSSIKDSCKTVCVCVYACVCMLMCACVFSNMI